MRRGVLVDFRCGMDEDFSGQVPSRKQQGGGAQGVVEVDFEIPRIQGFPSFRFDWMVV